jgi:hypothetical protein
MFNKRKCNKCGNNINKNYSFCPECGNRISYKDTQKEWGMLGEDDSIENISNKFSGSLFGGIGNKMLNQMINNTMKMLEKEMQRNAEDNKNNLNSRTNFELYINGKRINPENIKITNKKTQKEEDINESQNKFFSTENTKKFSELKKIEPKTNLRRLSNSLIYEIYVPGVKSIDNVSIIKLERSIEIKAISKDIAYSKIIPLDLKLLKYTLSKERLTLELKN